MSVKLGKTLAARLYASIGAGAFAFLTATSAHGYTTTGFTGATYDPDTVAMDAVLGLGGDYLIEDFEDTGLLPVLTIEYTNPNQAPINTLPNLYTQPEQFDNNYWDGNSALVNTPDNQNWNNPFDNLARIAQAITFHIGNGGASSFGIGFGNLQPDLVNVDHVVFVNGEILIPKLEDLAGFSGGINVRNFYLRIDAESGDAPITSVAIDIGSGKDGMIFDHVAIQPVPIPAAVWLFGSAVGLLGWRHRKTA